MTVPLEKLTSVYIKLRDKKAAMATAHKIEESEIDRRMKLIKDALLEYCKENNLNSAKTEAGTFTRTKKIKYWTSDWDSIYEFVKEHDLLEWFTKSLNQSNVKSFLEKNPDVFPKGLNADAEYVITVRKPTAKRG